MIKNNKFILILISCLFFTSKDIRSTDINSLKLITKLAGIFIGTSLVHELGHAITGKLLYNCPIDIHVGEPSENPYFKFGPFTINTFLTTRFNSIQTRNEPNDINKIKQIIPLISGPFSEILFINILNRSIKNNNIENKFLSLICKYYIFDQLVQGFTPLYFYENTDGDILWQMLGVNKKKLNKLKKILSYPIFVVSVCIFFKHLWNTISIKK